MESAFSQHSFTFTGSVNHHRMDSGVPAHPGSGTSAEDAVLEAIAETDLSSHGLLIKAGILSVLISGILNLILIIS